MITFASIFATLIPQGKEVAFYYATYPEFLGSLIIALQFDQFFSSMIFVIGTLVFTASLATCTVDRLVREFKGKRRKRFGPDIVHIGLLVLFVGGLVTFLGRKEVFFYIAEGEEVRIADSFVLQLESFEYFTYETGRPRDWYSTVDIYEDDVLIIDDYTIEVNNPLAVGSVDVFQTSYGNRPRTTVTDANGKSFILDLGSYVRLGDEIYLFDDVVQDPLGGYLGVFELWQNQAMISSQVVAPGERLGSFTVGTVEIREVTGLQAVRDPGYLPALIGFILCLLGLTLTYAQKFGDKEI